MPFKHIPLFARFCADVLDRGAQACLPSQLPDDWLAFLAAASAALVGESEQPDNCERDGIVLAAILTLSNAQDGIERGLSEPPGMPLDELFERVRDYGAELALEQRRRAAGVQYVPATLETLFAGRRRTATPVARYTVH